MKKVFSITLSFIVLFSFGQEVEKVNGIDKSNISKIGGVDVGDISNVMGIDFYDACDGETSILYDGQTYSFVAIGTQCWMAENLNIGFRMDSGDDLGFFAIQKYCYDDLDSNCDIFGGLYTWDEAMDWVSVEGAQGICPYGWHIPTDAEWYTLINFLCGQNGAGGKMKSTGISLWTTPNDGATNESGFTGLPGGRFTYWNGSFEELGNHGYFWSSTESFFLNAWTRYLYYDNDYAFIGSRDQSNGYSVRCLRDN